jgi:hypothetical protein
MCGVLTREPREAQVLQFGRHERPRAGRSSPASATRKVEYLAVESLAEDAQLAYGAILPDSRGGQ